MKQIMKRLMGIMLVIAMVIGVVPMSGVTVQAATISKGTRIYFDTKNMKEFIKDGAVPSVLFKDGENSTNGTWVLMTLVSGSSTVYYADADRDNVTHVQFRRSSSQNADWHSGTSTLALEAGKNCYTISSWNASNWNNSGTWSNGSGASETTTGVFYVDSTLVDYFNNARVENINSTDSNLIYWNQGNETGSNNAPYSKLNYWISNLDGYAEPEIATNADGTRTIYWNNWGREGDVYINYWGGGTTQSWVKMQQVSTESSYYKANIPASATNCLFDADKTYENGQLASNLTLSSYNLYTYKESWSYYDTNATTMIPLYFGDLYHKNQLLGNGNGVNSWYRGANVSFKDKVSAVAQGIVGKKLVDGNLVSSWDDEVEIPFFVKDSYNGQDSYMEFYNDLQFPFKSTTVNGVTTYSFDSKEQTVYYDYGEKVIKTSTEKVYDIKDTVGYFPFNKTNPSDKSQLNYGFGTKFTIPFTISKDGRDINGNDIIFSFTGDDDVWVYIDDALVLDMGGAHELASGTINFKEREATVEYAADAATDYQVYGENSTYTSNGNETVSFNEINVSVNNKEMTLEDYIQEDDKVHTLTMYYMERGMHNSNMSISFTFSPVPSGLVVSKDINTAGVNAGLATAVDNVDEFSFRVTATNNDSSVSFDSYTLTDHSNISTLMQASGNVITGVKSQKYAHSFLNGDNDAFVGGTKFEIEEEIENSVLQYDTNATTWNVYDADNNYKPVVQGTNLKAEFVMGDSDKKSYNYSVNYINTLKVGTLTLTKKWSGENAPSGSDFEFQVLLDLDGNGEVYSSQPYALAYTSDDGTNGTLSSDGKLKLAVNQKVTFGGIPAGATYQIVETEPGVNDTWIQDTTQNTTGTIEADKTATAVVTNKAKNTAFTNDQIVIDYGKKVQVDILENDASVFEGMTYAKKDDSYTYAVTKGSTTWNVETIGFVACTDENIAASVNELGESVVADTITTSNGVYSIADNKKVEFKLNRFLSEVDEVLCVVKVSNTSNPNDVEHYYNKLEVIPATSMYYEDTFEGFSYKNDEEATPTDSKWYNVTSAGIDLLQDEGTIGSNAPYGYDSSYANDHVYSDGSVQQVVVPENTELGGYNETYFEFSFKGTGFDLMASTGTDAATIKAVITASDGTTKNATVNNVGASELNQIPVLSCEGLVYGEYSVKVHVFAAYRNTEYPALDRGSTFKFDGLRIYDPINTSDAGEPDAATANQAYLVDKEAYEEHLEIRDLIIGTKDFDSTKPGTEGDGVVYIDAKKDDPRTANENASVSDYEVAGPNNETYLQEGSSVAFILNVSSIPQSIQIGAKSINGASVFMDVSLQNPYSEDEAYLGETFSHATAQNYGLFCDDEEKEITDFTPYFEKTDEGYRAYVTVANFEGATLSITDIKATFANQSTMGTTYSVQMANDMGISIGDENDETASEALALYSADFTTESVRYTKQATLTVVTSANVEEVVVENESGNVVSAAISSLVNDEGQIVWTLKFKPGAVGTRTFSVYGKDVDGNKTTTQSVSIEATRR